MQNGETGHCGNCHSFDFGKSHCTLRDTPIESAHWTTCRSHNGQTDEIIGPIYAIVCEVKQGEAAYGSIPYYGGIRVEAVRGPDGGDTVVKFVDSEGASHEFATVSEYMEFYQANGGEA